MIENILSVVTFAPYFWLFLAITIVMVFAAIKVKNQKSKIIMVNLVAIPLLLFIGEGFCWRINIKTSKTIGSIDRPFDFFQLSDALGYAPKKQTKAHVIKKIKRKKVYDVYYTINKDGLRETPSSNEASNKCLLFFGDSFMFGEGLNDNETLPYYVGEKTNYKYKIYNFGFIGYGPNQMLSALEHGIVDNVITECKESTVIYDAMPDHVIRIAGRKSWETNDPKYSLINNEAVYQGHFSDDKKKVPYKIKELYKKSQIYVFVNRLRIQKKERLKLEESIQYEKLYISILTKSKQILEEQYKVKRFVGLFWNWFDPGFDRVLRINSLEYYYPDEILSDYFNKHEKYFIENDVHPTKLANNILADFLIRQLNLNRIKN